MHYQYELFPASGWRTGESLRRALADASGLRIDLVMTRNRVSMISVQFVTDRHARLRMHEAFLQAPESVIQALVRYLRGRSRRSWNTVKAYAADIPASTHVQDQLPLQSLRSCGDVYDLSVIAKEINATYFNSRLKYRIGWGVMRRGRRVRRSIRYGSCDQATRVIRIHPLLDDRDVPREFVAYIVYHEMLHLVVPSEIRGNRRIDHSRTFQQLEAKYPNLERHRETANRLLQTLGRRRTRRA